MFPNDPKACLWLVLAVALVVRIAAAVGLQAYLDRREGQTFLIEGDANGYWALAEQLAAGREFAIYEPPRRVLRMPGFPALLAVPMTPFQRPFLPARLMLAVVGAVGCGLVYCLGRILFDTTIGLTAAALTAMSPTLVGFSPVVLSETTFAVCLLASLVAMAWFVKRCDCDPSGRGGPSPSAPSCLLAAAVIGASIGVACYVRPSWLLAAPVFGVLVIALLGHRRRSIFAAVLVCVGAVAVLLPWGVRNKRVTGHFVLTTLWMGPSLYDGLNPDATGDSDMTFYDRDNLLAEGMSEYEVNRHYRDAAFRFVRENPRRTVELAGLKLGRYFKPWPNAAQFGGWPSALIAAFTIPMFTFAAWGWWTTRANRWGWLLAVGPLLYFAALHMLFVSSLRYRLPAEYPLLVMTAVGLHSVFPRLSGCCRAPASFDLNPASS